MGLVLFGGACLAMGAILGVLGALRYIGSLGWGREPDVTGVPPRWEYGPGPELFVPSDSETKA